MTDLSIIILTKNAGTGFRETLAALYCQKDLPTFEIIIIDSGSTDGTLEICRQFPVRLVQIPPAEFGHGRTRNFGASLAAGEFLVFLVQDAIPVGTDCLSNLLAPLRNNEKIAGAYSRNIPRSDASRRQAQEIEAYFRPEGELRISPDDHIFSNVCSAVRRSVLARIPFPEVEFGEDQLWAKQVLEAGGMIRYEPTSRVVHSHQDDLHEAFQRGCREGGLARAFGQKPWHSSYTIIALEALYEAVRWALRGDRKSCWYSITMAAWHCGFRRGYLKREG